jgi:hypothetical protein
MLATPVLCRRVIDASRTTAAQRLRTGSDQGTGTPPPCLVWRSRVRRAGRVTLPARAVGDVVGNAPAFRREGRSFEGSTRVRGVAERKARFVYGSMKNGKGLT